MHRVAQLATAIALVWLVVQATYAQSAAEMARFAPADTLLAVTSGDLAQSCQDFQRTALGVLLCGPDFTPLVDELGRRGMAGPLNLAPQFGFAWRDLAEVRGPSGLFVFPIGKDELGVVWLFAGSASPGELPPSLAAAEKYFAAQNFTRAAAQKGGTRSITFTPPADVSKPKPSPRVLFIGNDRYGVANSPAAAEAVLAVTAERSLAAEDIWQQAPANTQTTARPGDARFLLKPLALWEQMRQADEREQAQRPPQPAVDPKEPNQKSKRDSLASAKQLGLDGVSAIVGQLSFPAEALGDWQIQANLLIPPPYTKALRMLELRPGNAPQLPSWLGSDVTSASFWRWDFPLAMQGFGSLFDEANEPGPDGVGMFEDLLDGLRDDPEGVQVDLRRDVFAHLGPELASITDRRGPKTKAQPQGDRALYVTPVRAMPTVLAALSRFYQGDDRVKRQRRGNYDVWSVGEGASLFVEGESDSVVSVRVLALGENKMLFGTDVELLLSTLAHQNAPAASEPAWKPLWQATLERAAGPGALWGISQLADTFEPAYQAALAPDESAGDGLLSGLWRILMFGTAARDAGPPYGAAPAFDRVRAALPAAGTSLVPAPGGWSITTTAARPSGS